jgi:outer membrane protein OmpA-like peptidoglycan-associated protein
MRAPTGLGKRDLNRMAPIRDRALRTFGSGGGSMTGASMRNFICLLIGACALLFGCGESNAQNRVALVIGNDRYPNLPADRQLQKAVNDARAMGNALQQLGFNVIRGENLDRGQIVDHIVRFTRAIKPGDIALVFFAGHGVSLSGANYLLPADIPLPPQGEEIRVRNMAPGESDLVADIQAAKPRVLIMVLDACRDNPFRQAGLTRSVGSQAGLARSREAEGVFTIYSAGFGQAALDRLGDSDRSPNSVFTRVLIPALARTDAHLADIVIDMREEVARLAATIGHEQYPAYYDQTRGGRIFLTQQGRPTPPPAGAAVPRAPQVALAPPVVRIPYNRYIVDSEEASPEVLYETMMAPPVERIERRYSLDEIRYSPTVRQRMPSIDVNTINFELGSWEVPPDQAAKLQAIADGLNRAIQENPRAVFLIEGHTDAVGNDVDNLSLSDRRAESAATLLTQQFNVPAENLTSQGYGEQYLKEQTDGPSAINRRVTIRNITPLLNGGQASLPPPPPGTAPPRR